MKTKERETPLKHEDQTPPPDRPPYFYKYKSIDEHHPEYSSRIFTHNELYFSSVNDFNDPFDCRFQVKFRGSDDDKVKFIDDELKKQAPHLPSEERLSIARENSKFLSDHAIANEANAIRDRARQAIEKWGICCLSEVQNNILMWSHYAKAHHGFCLEFSNELHIAPNVYQSDIREIAPFPVVPLDVKYSEEYPVFNPVSPDDSAIQTLLTKAKQWKYEKEWRIVFPGGTGSYQFEPQCLTGVIFGCRMSKEHKEMLSGWCRDQRPVIKYYEAQQNEDSYSLKIVEIS